MAAIRTEYYNNILCIEGGWLYKEGDVMTFSQYKNALNRNQFSIVRRGGGASVPALVEWKSIPQRFKAVIIEKFGNPEEITVKTHLEKFIRTNSEVYEYFSNYLLPDGRNLKPEVINEYYNSALVLDAMHEMLNNCSAKRKALGGSLNGVWEMVCNAVNELDKKRYPHTLPSCERRLKDKYNEYKKEGYSFLIHKNFCNNNARVVTKKLERLLLSIYCMSNNPYVAWVCDEYLRFLSGDINIIDMETGEMFDRADFYNEKGEPVVVSEATTWNYINNPANRILMDNMRMGYHKFGSHVRPHHHRHAPVFSLSKISLDDRDLPRRLHDGSRVKAYYAYDVASGVLIGAAYSLKKDANLFVECIRNMFRFLDNNGLGTPLEMEIEHHLVRLFQDDLMSAGVVFPFVRWCAPTNSQEKHAEQFNRQKKYGYEKRYQDGIGRFYLKLEANQTTGERVYDETGNKYVIKEKTYSFEQLVADDLATIKAYNNGKHRNQKLHSEKTRMQVFTENLNPNLANINRPVLARYIGNCTVTTIQRNQYVQVQYADYQLSSPEILSRLKPNNYTVQAYWVPSDNGEINEVYLYQNNEFICKANKIITYNTAIAERTEVDTLAMTEQSKYIAQFDKFVRTGKQDLIKIKTSENSFDFKAITPEIITENTQQGAEFDLEKAVENYSGDWFKERAIEAI